MAPTPRSSGSCRSHIGLAVRGGDCGPCGTGEIFDTEMEHSGEDQACAEFLRLWLQTLKCSGSWKESREGSGKVRVLSFNIDGLLYGHRMVYQSLTDQIFKH